MHEYTKNHFYGLYNIFFITSNFLIPRVITIFSHGIADTNEQVYKYVKYYKKNDVVYHNCNYVIHAPFVSFNYPDATRKFYRVNYNETSFGQQNEIEQLESRVLHYKNDNIILFGISRGASNIGIFMGLRHYENVKAIVLESPYFHMSEVIENIMYKIGIGWIPLSYGETITEFIFKKYTRHGNSPAKYIEYVMKDIPILIICSEQDTLIPYTSSMNFYKKLVESGHEHVYIFVAKYGKHASILQGKNGKQYQCVANAFYKKYDFPHCPLSASKGEILLNQCQPYKKIDSY